MTVRIRIHALLLPLHNNGTNGNNNEPLEVGSSSLPLAAEEVSGQGLHPRLGHRRGGERRVGLARSVDPIAFL